MDNKDIENNRGSVDIFESDENIEFRKKLTIPNIWRHSPLAGLISPTKKRNGSFLFDSTPPTTPEEEETSSRLSSRSRTSQLSQSSVVKEEYGSSTGSVVKAEHGSSTVSVMKAEHGSSTVSVVVVEAKGLPNAPSDGSPHSLYCKVRLGSHTLKTKSVNNSHEHPVWQERLQLRQHGEYLLRASLWDKGKQKSFMGSCVLDLSHLSKDRTHEVWQTLDDGYGSIHLSITIWNHRKDSSQIAQTSPKPNIIENPQIFSFKDWNVVGELHVRVVSAKGLGGKPYCLMEVDNERVQTHATSSSTEYTWDKSFIFKVYDVTSTLDLKVFDNSLASSFRNDCMGRVVIPLLRINNGETRWYALKDRSKRGSARGNCPRLLLEMTLRWNPIKASLRVFKPKEVKYDKKPRKFDIGLIYKNIEFIRDTFVNLLKIDEGYKQLLEWENKELSCMVLFCWIFFWYNFQMWATPLLLLTPFIYSWILGRHQQEKSFMRGYGIIDESSDIFGKGKMEKSLTGRALEIPEMTLTITDGIEYIASLAEKLYNLATFKVPFLSYLTMFLLVIAAIGLYLIPFNYIIMVFGIYKFSRKYFDPERVLNNDLVDFLSRLPDTEEVRDWKELNVPEPSPFLNHRKLE